MNTVRMRLLPFLLFVPFILTSQPSDFFEEGRKLHAVGNYADALSYYKMAIVDAPSHEAAIFNHALCALELNKMKVVEKDVERLIEINPNNMEMLEWRGNLRMKNEDWVGAISDFTSVLEREEIYEARLNRAVAYLETDQIDFAATNLNKLESFAPNSNSARLNAVFGDYFLKIGNAPQALAKYQESLADEPNNAIVLNNCGLIHTKSENYEAAIPFFEKAFQMGSDPQIHANLIMAYLKNGDLENAAASSKSFMLAHHDEPLAYYAQGMVHFENKQFSLAIEEFSQAIDLESDFVDACLMRGKSCLRLELTAAAIEDFEKILELEPENAEAKLLLEKYEIDALKN